MNKLFERTVALGMATVMTIGAAGVVSARVADNTNIAAKATWTGFSVQTDDPDWVKAEFEATGQEPGTNGYIASSSASGFVMNVVNTGWDGEWNTHTNPPVLAADMPYGLTATSSTFPVEAGRSYTISFKIQSTLHGTYQAEDDNGNAVGEAETINDKQIYWKVYTTDRGEPALDLTSVKGSGSDGYMTLTNGKDATEVSATFTIKEDYSGSVGIKFAFGAFLKSLPKQIAMKGRVTVTDFKIVANHQHSVKFVSQGKTVKTSWVNPDARVASYTPARKGYTFAGWYLNGTKYNFYTKVKGDITLTAKWTKTKKPARAKISKVKSTKSKRLTVNIKKVKNAVGYQIQYANNKKFKSKKTKTTKKISYTIKKLKSGVKYYVRVKAYTTDSAGNKIYSKKWSKVKNTYVR